MLVVFTPRDLSLPNLESKCGQHAPYISICERSKQKCAGKEASMFAVPLGKECFHFIYGFILCMLELERVCEEQGPLARCLHGCGVNSLENVNYRIS